MSDEGSSKKKPLMKMLLMAVIGLVLIGGIGGGGFFAYKKLFGKPATPSPEAQANAKETGKETGKDAGKAEDEDEDAASAGEKGEGGEGGATGPAILVYKNNVNLENKRNAYLVVELHVIFRDAELGKLATSDKPTLENSTVRSMILEAISGKTIEEVSDPEMREAVRTEIKEKLNEKFAPKPLKAGEKEDKKHKKPKHPIKEVLVVSWAVAQ